MSRTRTGAAAGALPPDATLLARGLVSWEGAGTWGAGVRAVPVSARRTGGGAVTTLLRGGAGEPPCADLGAVGVRAPGVSVSCAT